MLAPLGPLALTVDHASLEKVVWLSPAHRSYIYQLLDPLDPITIPVLCLLPDSALQVGVARLPGFDG